MITQIAAPKTAPVRTHVSDSSSRERLDPETSFAVNLDRRLRAGVGKFTFSISPIGLSLIYLDWLLHLSFSPGKNWELLWSAVRNFSRIAAAGAAAPGTSPAIEPSLDDRRFSRPEWRQWPFNLYRQSFLLTQQWWKDATTAVPGVSRHHEQVVKFIARQMLDAFAPTNFPGTNPEVMKASLEQAGKNYVRGMMNFQDDCACALTGSKPAGTESFEVGKTVATTPGKVVYRNELIELIQYSPATDMVHSEPILIVPAWIMKYYILDLSPRNSLVKYLVEQGHTVFMISWKNPEWDDRDTGFDDYRSRGVLKALDAVAAICPGRRIHAAGYCLGGTTLAITAAALARDADERLATMTLFAAQTDFSEPGELALFVDEEEIGFLADVMWDQGFLDPKQMGGTFQLLRSQDLVWSGLLRDYLLGNRDALNDLMAWNADGTRLPYRMHSEYLQTMYLRNDLAAGRYEVAGRPVAIQDVHVPILAVGTVKDHVAPWKSVYKIHLLADTDVTFVLTSGGHNAGIVSEPGHPHRSYQMATHHDGERYVDPETWQRVTPKSEGSWWPAWQDWLVEHSTGRLPSPQMGCFENGYAPLCEAPGEYVMQQ